jgi:hypothetical protein
MEREQRTHSRGAFSWSAGGWFGAQVGSTLWLVVLGVVLTLRGESSLGTAVIALSVAVNGIGLLLWEHRDRVEPYPAIQALVATVGGAAVVAFVLLDRAAAWDLDGPGLPRPPYATLLVFPALMAFFALQRHAMHRDRRHGGDPGVAQGGRRS